MARHGKTTAVATIVAASLVLCAAVVLLGDRILREWKVFRLANGAEAEQRAAAAWLVEAGETRAVPLLLGLLPEGRSGFRREGWCDVIEPFDGLKQRFWPLACVERFAERAVPALLLGLEHSRAETRSWSLRALEPLAPGCQEALSGIIGALADEDDGVRRIARWILDRARERGQVGQAALPALIGALEESEDPGVRLSILWTIGGLGPWAEPALPAVTRALEDGRPVVRRRAAAVLETIRGN